MKVITFGSFDYKPRQFWQLVRVLWIHGWVLNINNCDDGLYTIVATFLPKKMTFTYSTSADGSSTITSPKVTKRRVRGVDVSPFSALCRVVEKIKQIEGD